MPLEFNRRQVLKSGAAIGAAAAFGLGSPLAAVAAENEMEVVEITPSLVAKAKEEGGLMFRYASPVDLMTPVVKTFEQQYGISVQMDRKAGSSGNQQFATEERAGQHIMDVSSLTDPVGLQAMAAEGHYLYWTLPDLEKKLPKGTYILGWGYSQQWNELVIPYNPEIVPHEQAKEIFQTWKGFLEPSLKGRIGLVEPAATNLAFLTYMMFFELPQYGQSFFEALAAQEPRLYKGSAAGREDIAAGATGTFIPQWESAAMIDFMSGGTVAWVFPEVTPTTALNHVAISKNAPHPNAARLFAAWMFTEDAARALQHSQTRGTLLGVPDERPALAKLKETEWWTPHRAEPWNPDIAHWQEIYPTLMPEMRRMLGWRG